MHFVVLADSTDIAICYTFFKPEFPLFSEVSGLMTHIRRFVPSPHQGKPWILKSLAEQRISIALVRLAGDVWNQPVASWMWENEGLPMPPSVLLPGWHQPDLFQGDIYPSA
jgi:hypothetical protein